MIMKTSGFCRFQSYLNNGNSGKTLLSTICYHDSFIYLFLVVDIGLYNVYVPACACPKLSNRNICFVDFVIVVFVVDNMKHVMFSFSITFFFYPVISDDHSKQEIEFSWCNILIIAKKKFVSRL